MVKSAMAMATALIVWPDGNDQPCADTSRMACGGRSRPTTVLPILTPPASPAHANTATTKAKTGRRLVMTSTTTTMAATSSATHEPSQVTDFMTELSAAVREFTTARVT